MLEICRARAHEAGVAPGIYEQPMERLELPRSYRTVLVPSSSFQLLTQRERAESAMGGFAAQLEPGGRLVMPFMIPIGLDAPETP